MEEKQQNKQESEKDALRCYSCFVPTLTKYTCGPVPECVWLCVCVCGASVHDCPTPLCDATFAGISNGNVCATTTHKYTHTLRQTNVFSASGPSFGLFCLFSASCLAFALSLRVVCCLSLCPMIQRVVNVTLIEEKRGFFLST